MPVYITPGTKPIHKQFARNIFLYSLGCEYMRCMHLLRNELPRNICMYWNQRCVNTATVSMQREGAKVRIHFEKVRIHISKKNPRKDVPVFARLRIQTPHAFAEKLIPQEILLHVLVLCRGVCCSSSIDAKIWVLIK